MLNALLRVQACITAMGRASVQRAFDAALLLLGALARRGQRSLSGLYSLFKQILSFALPWMCRRAWKQLGRR